MILRLADLDWLSAPTDAPANTRFEGLIDPAGVTLVAELGGWMWGGESPAQAGAASVGLLDAGGLLDAAALGDLSGSAVSIQQVDMDGTLASAVTVGRYVVDALRVQDDGRKTLTLRDAHDNMDTTLNPGEFSASVTGQRDQVQPAVIGAVSNAPVLLTGSDGSVGWISDAPITVATLRDRADPMETGTFSMGTLNQQVRMQSPPIGPMTADVSSIGVSAGEPTPATLQQTLAEVFRRAGITAWSSADAAAIDTATGYAGIGYYAGRKVTVRQALAAILPSYGAWYYQDGTGTLRFTRIVAPEAAGAAHFALDASDLSEDLVFTNDAAPRLSRRMAWRPNARVMAESDYVTDLVDVPPSLRARLSSDYAGIVTAAGALPAEYRHAIDADPIISLFWREADAQAEINRIAALFSGARRLYVAKVKGDVAFDPRPGQTCLLTYPRYGLDTGRKLLVRRVERNPATGDVALYLWGA